MQDRKLRSDAAERRMRENRVNDEGQSSSEETKKSDREDEDGTEESDREDESISKKTEESERVGVKCTLVMFTILLIICF